jgi:hypothetical protein
LIIIDNFTIKIYVKEGTIVFSPPTQPSLQWQRQQTDEGAQH